MTKKKDWREGTLKWRDIWPLFVVYFGIIFAVDLVSLLFPLEERQIISNVSPALALGVLGFLWGRCGDKWSNAFFFTMAPGFKFYKHINDWLDTLLTVAILFVGYGAGVLSKRLGSSQVKKGKRK